jgi:hypothetical protein
MYFINSLTDTTGLMSPQSAACGTSVFGAGIGFDDEHAVIVPLRRTSPARVVSR